MEKRLTDFTNIEVPSWNISHKEVSHTKQYSYMKQQHFVIETV